jgi:HK97 family phage prohead protease
MRKVTKLFISKAQSIDEKAMTAKFKISDGLPDRMGEIVDQKSWNFDAYMANPLLLWGHDPSQPENVLGNGLELAYDEKEDATFATVRFDKDINPKAELIFNQVARGTLRAVSVGMIVHSEENEKDQVILKDCELLEISVVPIPANPRAIALAFAEGTMSEKDAKFLMESMEREVKHLQKEFNSDTKETVMSKLPKVAKAVKKIKAVQPSADLSDDDTKFLADLLDRCNQVDVAIDTADALIDQILVDLSAFLGVDNPDEDAQTDDPEDDPAAGGDGGDDEDTEPPAKGATIPKKKSTKANGGESDQPGAEDDGADEEDEADSVDEDTELTPEQQKEFEEELDKNLTELNVK